MTLLHIVVPKEPSYYLKMSERSTRETEREKRGYMELHGKETLRLP